MKKGCRYLCERLSYTTPPRIYEFVCLEISETSYKLKNNITKEILWFDKILFTAESAYGHSDNGYYIKECLGKYNERKK